MLFGWRYESVCWPLTALCSFPVSSRPVSNGEEGRGGCSDSHLSLFFLCMLDDHQITMASSSTAASRMSSIMARPSARWTLYLRIVRAGRRHRAASRCKMSIASDRARSGLWWTRTAPHTRTRTLRGSWHCHFLLLLLLLLLLLSLVLLCSIDIHRNENRERDR